MKKILARILGHKYEYYKDKLRTKVNRLLPSNISYSQFGEDILINYHIERLGLQKGVYIDVGACHPVYMSNTYKLYLKGWRGVNIDPTPASMQSFNLYRPEDINIELAISENEGESDFYLFKKNPELNTLILSKEMKSQYDFYNLQPDKIIKVETIPLKKICQKYLHNKEVNFLDIDAEGFDLVVLNTYDWDSHLPELILIEEHSNFEDFIYNSDIYKFLKSKNYAMVGKIGPSYLFSTK